MSQIKNTLRFPSLHAAAVHARDTPRAADADEYSNKVGPRTWDLGMDLATAIKHGTDGLIWAQGVARIKHSLGVIEKLQAKAPKPQIKHDVVGGSVSIGRYVTGHPRNMRRLIKRPAVDKPVLSFAIPMGIASSTKAEQRLNFGAALVSAVSDLERSGTRCELSAVWRCATTHNQDPTMSRWISLEVLLKAPTQRFNPATIAWVCAHPAAQRRLFWRIAESHAGMVEAGICNRYGDNTASDTYDESMASDYDVYFQNMMPRQQLACGTPEGAYNYVKETLQRQLDDTNKAMKKYR